MKINLTKIVPFLAAILLTISCSQKYDNVGIFDPASPTNNWNLTSTATASKGVVDSCNLSSDSKLYLGSRSLNGEIIASSHFILDFAIAAADTSLDSTVLVLPMISSEEDISSSCLDTKIIEIYVIRGDGGLLNGSDSSWNEYDKTFRIAEQDTSYYKSVAIIDSSEFFNKQYHIRSLIPADSIRSWFTARENNNFFGLLFKLQDDYTFQPQTMGDFFSSKWSAELYRPNLEKYRTVLNAAGEDSIVGYRSALSKDASVIFKKTELLASGTTEYEEMIKIGAVSGEGVFYRFDIPDSIPVNASVLTARIKLKRAAIDPLFGALRDSETITKELEINRIDSIRTADEWYTDLDTLIQHNEEFLLKDLYTDRSNVRYDTLNFTSRTDIQTDSLTYFRDITTLVSEWIAEPGKNLGFYMRAVSWDNPLGHTLFLKPELEITYLKPGEE